MIPHLYLENRITFSTGTDYGETFEQTISRWKKAAVRIFSPLLSIKLYRLFTFDLRHLYFSELVRSLYQIETERFS